MFNNISPFFELSEANNSSIISFIIFNKASSGEDNRELSHELIQICLKEPFFRNGDK